MLRPDHQPPTVGFAADHSVRSAKRTLALIDRLRGGLRHSPRILRIEARIRADLAQHFREQADAANPHQP